MMQTSKDIAAHNYSPGYFLCERGICSLSPPNAGEGLRHMTESQDNPSPGYGQRMLSFLYAAETNFSAQLFGFSMLKMWTCILLWPN